MSQNELETRVAELERRVSELEGGNSTQTDRGLDHRDQAVIDHIRETGKSHPRQLVSFYQTLTDIQNRNTAIKRAKNLQKHPSYADVVGE